MTDLRACPFCGNIDKLGVRSKTSRYVWNAAETDRLRWDRFSVRCPKCRARGPVVSGFVGTEPRMIEYNGQEIEVQTKDYYTALAKQAWNRKAEGGKQE